MKRPFGARIVMNIESGEVIYKYPLELGTNHVSLPARAKILTVNCKDGIHLYAIINRNQETVTRKFLVIGTGTYFVNTKNYEYIGTVEEGIYIWHIFEVLN